MMNLRRCTICCFLGSLVAATAPCRAQSLVDPAEGAAPPPVDTAQPSVDADGPLDPQVVYRFVPAVQQGRLGQRLAPVAVDDLKTRSVYYRFNPALNRHTWSVLAKDGRWYFALGEGSTVRTELLDIRLTAEQRVDILDAFAPRLKQKLEEPDKAQNINLYLRLDGLEQWRLQSDSLTPKVQSVFDLETGHRWEWHGEQRHAVLHTTGDMWQAIDGNYRPISIFVPVVYDGCFRRPAGSVLNVVRTSPLPE